MLVFNDRREFESYHQARFIAWNVEFPYTSFYIDAQISKLLINARNTGVCDDMGQ